MTPSSLVPFPLQNATRILRALFDMVLRAGGAIMAGRMLTLCKVVERQTWHFETPLKQFSELSCSVLRNLEEKDMSLEQIKDLSGKDIGEGSRLHLFVVCLTESWKLASINGE